VEPAHNPKDIRNTSLLINDRPINTDNNFIPNQINLTTKSPTNSTNPKDLSSQNPNQNLTQKTLPVTNVTRKDTHPVSARSIPNFMSSK
jgi:hypothetical protein